MTSAFDTIVVGAGSAGAIVASRLSEDGRHRVLLIEAGPDYDRPESMPPDLLDSRDLAGPAHDWHFRAAFTRDREQPYPRGRVIGGTSAINAAGAQWGSPDDFARWAALGNPSWTWDAVAPWYQRLEADPTGVGAHHGREGPVPIARYSPDEWVPVQRAFHAGCRSVGVPEILDQNGLGGLGVGPWPMNRVGRTRMSSALTHLAGARARPNLVIRANEVVDRLSFSEQGVDGVELGDGSVVEGGRVMLSAGVIGSPAILMRSGIGDAGELRSIGVDPRVDLPGVGAKLWDHPAVPVLLVPLPGECVIGRDPRFQVVARYTGAGSEAVGDMQLVMLTHADLSAEPGVQAEAGVPVAAMLAAALMLPTGCGRLTLLDRNPSSSPRIELGFGADEHDLGRLADGVRRGWEVLNSAAMAGACRRVVLLTDDVVGSDELLRAYILATVRSYCHAVGTAPMGPDPRTGAVVDQDGAVHGVDGLFVVDASIVPAIPRVVPNLTVMMLAERLSDRLRQRS